MRKIRRAFKRLYLTLRSFKFLLFSTLTSYMRKKSFHKKSTRSVLVISLKRVGDAVLSIPAFRAIKQSLPKSQVTVFADSYIKDILESIPYIDAVVPYSKRSSFLNKAKLVRKLAYNSFDLAVDMTCDHSIEGALWTWLSRARYRVGYDIWKRGFLFNLPVHHEKGLVHATDEIYSIVKSLGLKTRDKTLKINPSEESIDSVQKLLRGKKVRERGLIIGIHPGGYYPTQRWLSERFAEVADYTAEKYSAHIVLMGGSNEEGIIQQIKTHMSHPSIVFFDQPLGDLLALIQSCRLLICNNSGPLHMATALGTPTVSTMGPTIPERWWPHGKGHIVLRVDLPCMPCNEGRCRIKTLDCMKLITVKDMIEAVDSQMSKAKKAEK